MSKRSANASRFCAAGIGFDGLAAACCGVDDRCGCRRLGDALASESKAYDDEAAGRLLPLLAAGFLLFQSRSKRSSMLRERVSAKGGGMNGR